MCRHALHGVGKTGEALVSPKNTIDDYYYNDYDDGNCSA